MYGREKDEANEFDENKKLSGSLPRPRLIVAKFFIDRPRALYGDQGEGGEAKISGGVPFSLSLSLPQSVLQREGMICLGRKRGRRFQDAFIHAAARSFFTIYFASARGKGFIARGGEEGDESGEEKEEQRIIYICVCVMSRQIFQSWLKLCFRDQVTFHSTDDSL